MTTMERIARLGSARVLCLDGAYGTVIAYDDGEVGVLVPREDDIRWIGAEHIEEVGNGAVREVEKVTV